MKVYIAGPMTGYPQFNFPAFHEAAATLRARGHEVVSPAEEDPPEVQAAALVSVDGHDKIPGHTWGDLLARDVKIVADVVDAVAVLPGWAKSRGALLEVVVALLSGKRVYDYAPPAPKGMTLLDPFKVVLYAGEGILRVAFRRLEKGDSE